jgi:hypothetical protein
MGKVRERKIKYEVVAPSLEFCGLTNKIGCSLQLILLYSILIYLKPQPEVFCTLVYRNYKQIIYIYFLIEMSQ